MPDDERRRLEALANAYLAQQLAERAPTTLMYEGTFDEQPLDGEGRTTLFSFVLPATGLPAGPLGQRPGERHYVAVGETEPNYFPSYGLGSDDGYSLHLGLHFALELGIRFVAPALEPPRARAALEEFARACAPGAQLGGVELPALFRCDEQYFAVYRLTLDGQAVYCLGADCPPGFYRLTPHPPQVALHLHLGQLIRAEAQQARRQPRPGA
jgi:hypothetical protein